MIPQTVDPKDMELLEQIARGTTYFRPVQDKPSDRPCGCSESNGCAAYSTEG